MRRAGQEVAGPAHPLPSAPRKDSVSVMDKYQYPDPEDTFSREPFVVKFSTHSSGEALAPPGPAPCTPAGPSDIHPLPPSAPKELVLVPLHAAPHQAVAEIDALYDVYLDVIDKWGTDVSPRPHRPGPKRRTPGQP